MGWAIAALVLAFAVFGCAAPPLTLRPAASPADASGRAALRAAVEAYYTAVGPAELRAAVEAARAIAPEAALTAEIEADLAVFELRRFDQFDALRRALLDPSNDQSLLHLHTLGELEWTADEKARLRPVLEALVGGHPSAETRALAAQMLANLEHFQGRFEARDAALATLGTPLDWAVVGTWDNDQGKGFDTEQPPERVIDLGARYPGKLVEIGWRTSPVTDPRGPLDVAGLLDPVRWQVAYLAAAVTVPAAGPYELHFGTSDPVKIWVNDVLVFQVPAVADWLTQGFVVPVTLPAGVNRILVKQAHEAGSWLFDGRLTGPGGVVVSGLRAVPADTHYADGPPPVTAPIEPEAIVARRLAGLPEGSARLAHHAAEWAERLGLRVLAVARAEAFAAAHPRSLTARYQLAGALWDNQERGTTSDLLTALAQEAGPALPFLRLKMARFLRQQNLTEQARAEILAVQAAHPDRPAAALQLADLYGDEGWTEDRCTLLSALDARFPDWPSVQIELGDCWEQLKFFPQAEQLYREVLARAPNDVTMLQRLQWQALGNEDFDTALSLAHRLTQHWPHLRSSWERLAEAQRRAGDVVGAEATLKRLVELVPTAAVGHARLAELYYQNGRRDEALAAWQRALERDPENEKLAHRLDFLAPESRGAWAADVPDEAAIAEAVASRPDVKVAPAADVLYLLDDEVTALRADGSTVNYITTVAHAVNDAGRDRLTHQTLRSDGRARILHAYVVDAAGKRTEASTIRGRSVRFRQLGVGSTVVLQYRLDSPPDGYLAGHMARQWWFAGTAAQARVSRWVLYVPQGTPLIEERRGTSERSERAVGDLVRVEWSARDVAPVMPEPSMPTLHEAAANLVVSTVPDWGMFVQWEAALLKDAFRVGPEVEALAKRLFEGATSPADKVDRIQEWLMDEIRYQQDYEGFIAGVKPHAAPVVVARRYGDCKDKAVLFITLAHLGGIKAHFALVRTRDAGPVLRKVPMQQFNHAIVYVPAQPGLPEGRFFDPTVELLDLDVLRHDDQGTTSLVLDPAPFLAGRAAPDTRPAFEWREIPYQAAALDTSTVASRLALAEDGSAAGQVTMTARGRVASSLRRAARNAEQLTQMLQQQIGGTLAGGRISDVETGDLTHVRQPATLNFKVAAPSAGRREGDELRVKIPVGWSASAYFTLGERRFPLLLGAPRTLVWTVDLEAPAQARVKRLPQTTRIESPCLTFERQVSGEGRQVTVRQTVAMTCERVSPADYAQQRRAAEDIQRFLDEDVVFAMGKERPLR
ncbi:tetratricopeptide repeat protein [Myxococcota bacterium]|nr:tetratricopeptide repeat protein [Myxococcota bacterium]